MGRQDSYLRVSLCLSSVVCWIGDTGPEEPQLNPAEELVYGSDKLIEANHLNGMAAVYEKRHEYPDAQRLYEEALSIYEEIFGLEHFTTALVTRNLARVLRHQGKTAEASLMEDHANEMLSKRGSDEPARQTPFGGSAGFFELMGTNYTKLEETEENEQQ